MFGLFRHRWARVALVAVPLMLATPLAFAGLRSLHGCGMHAATPEQALSFARPIVGHVLDELDVNPKQRESLETILEESVRDGFELRTTGVDLRERFRDAMAAKADAAAIDALRQESVDLFDQGSRLAVERMTAVRSVLTDAQWAKLQELHEERSAWHDRW